MKLTLYGFTDKNKNGWTFLVVGFMVRVICHCLISQTIVALMTWPSTNKLKRKRPLSQRAMFMHLTTFSPKTTHNAFKMYILSAHALTEYW